MTRAGAAAPAAPLGARLAALAAAAAAAVTIAVRLPLAYRSFDLFGDEVIYTGLGRSVSSGGWPRNPEGPFFLHPPGFFYLEAGWARLLPRPADVVSAVYQMRTLNVLLAAVTAAVLVLLAARAAGWQAGAAAGLLFALDPFCVRQNDRVLLETATMLWVLLGYLVAAGLTGPSPPAGRRGWLRAGGAGLLFACAVLTKDQAVLLTVLPLAAAAAAGWGPRRRYSLLMAGIPVAVYGGYLAVVALTGQFGTLWESRTAGARRLLGLQQITGFNSPTSPSLAARLAAEAAGFWPTYAVLVLAVPAGRAAGGRRQRGRCWRCWRCWCARAWRPASAGRRCRTTATRGCGSTWRRTCPRAARSSPWTTARRAPGAPPTGCCRTGTGSGAG